MKKIVEVQEVDGEGLEVVAMSDDIKITVNPTCQFCLKPVSSGEQVCPPCRRQLDGWEEKRRVGIDTRPEKLWKRGERPPHAY